MAETYRVVTHGLKDGFSSDSATEKLVALFKSTKDRVRPLLESNDVVVKKGLDHPSAAKYKHALERCGCHCRVEPDEAAAAAKSVASPVSEQQIRSTIVPRLQRQRTDEKNEQSPDALVFHPLTGDLALSFTFKHDGVDTNITHRMLDAMGMTAAGLFTLAAENLYALVHPVLQVKQMRLAPQGKPDAAESISFFNYLETGGGMEAACILLAPIWASVKGVVTGPLRIVVPTQHTCMFCGADDALTFAMMCDIARDTKAEAGESGLSDLIYTVADDGSLSVVAEASDPGEITLSPARLREIQPQLFTSENDNSKRSLQVLADQLQSGDSRAAVVVDAQNGIVAAYTDELDCVALLKFDPNIARTKGWQTGTRLLTVNGYTGTERGIAADLVPGPESLGNYGNFRPLIADLLTDDLARLQHRKSQISADEWSRALEMGRRALALKWEPRDGRPLFCANPAKTAPKTNARRDATVKEPDPVEQVSFGQFARALAGMLLCGWLVGAGVSSHLRSMPADISDLLVWLLIVVLAMAGWQCGRVVVRYVRVLAGAG